MERLYLDRPSTPEQLDALLRPRLGQKLDGKRLFCGDAAKFDKGQYQQKGYEPVVVDGKHVYLGDDPLLMIAE